MALDTIIDWVTDANACYLIGAGCSRCAGKPTMEDLTNKVKTELSDKGKKLLADMNGRGCREATAEDLMDYLLRLGSLVLMKKKAALDGWKQPDTEDEIGRIKRAIVAAIGTQWTPSDTHELFFRRLASHERRQVCDVYSLNYDLVLEATLEALQIAYVDGFCGSENAYFDEAVLDQPSDSDPRVRLHKLHGSVNWTRDSDDVVRRKPASSLKDEPRLVIFPSEQKYVQTQYGVYEILLRRFRQRLREHRPNNKLIVMGYSFCDEHINLAIQDSVCAEGSGLTVYAFVGPQGDVATQVQLLKGMADRCNDRFNAILGSQEFIGPAMGADDWASVKDRELWKFENLVKLIVEGK